MYLVDTNVWLERLLGQEKSEEVGDFLSRISTDQMGITDFSLHSIGVITSRLKRPDIFTAFLSDTCIEGAVSVISLAPEQMHKIAQVMIQHHLDFDDAYQYVAAEEYHLILMSYDTDFDRTPIKRTTPDQAR
ncbi:PIN domain-containing protein [Methanoregula sp.]|uniref:type II toxin-antitoxin system VapC family toxin n=1 Tax=Methanoregula sp. TaxID=2052170 RepID=UPI0025E7BE23|nr:PIN domain-containing protein [Methanoregula sp.]